MLDSILSLGNRHLNKQNSQSKTNFGLPVTKIVICVSQAWNHFQNPYPSIPPSFPSFFFNISPYHSSPAPQIFCIFSYHQFLPIKCSFFQPETDFWRIGEFFLFFILLSLLPSPDAIAVHFPCGLSCHHFTMWADEVFQVLLSTENSVF